MIKITFPDGAVREFESGVTTFDIAQSISNSLAKKALAGKFNGKLIDTTRAITEDGSIEIVTPDHEDALDILRHSAAHLFAQAARRLFPDNSLGCWSSYRRWILLRYRQSSGSKSLTKTSYVSKKK